MRPEQLHHSNEGDSWVSDEGGGVTAGGGRVPGARKEVGLEVQGVHGQRPHAHILEQLHAGPNQAPTRSTQ